MNNEAIEKLVSIKQKEVLVKFGEYISIVCPKNGEPRSVLQNEVMLKFPNLFETKIWNISCS